MPDGSDISITEMEFNRAVERKASGELKEILVFLMHEGHPTTRPDVEADATAQDRLVKLKARASSGRVQQEFRSAIELRGLVVQALADVKRRIEKAAGGPPAPSFHPPSNIPTATGSPTLAGSFRSWARPSLIFRRSTLRSFLPCLTWS